MSARAKPSTVVRFAALSLAALLAAAGAGRAEEPPAGDAPPKAAAAARPLFELDGKPFEPSILSVNGDPEHPVPGDIAFVDDIPLVLGEGPAYRFRTTDRDADGRIYLLLPGGQERVVGARTKWTLEGRDNRFVMRNLLEPLTDAELAGLWGLHLDGWDEAVAAKVAKIDPARTCVAMTGACAKEGRNHVRTMPALPAGLRALILDDMGSQWGTDMSALAAQEALVLFRTDEYSDDRFDLALLGKSAATLRHLRLGRAKFQSPEVLASFTALRELDLAGNKGVSDLGFVRGMTGLRRIDLRATPVADLGPLGGLAKLEFVHANGSRAEALPSGPMPALRTLRVMSTRIPAAASAAFARDRASCRVWHGWNDTLHRELTVADRVVVRSGGTCHRDVEKERVLLEIPGTAKVREFLDPVSVVEPEGAGRNCMCCGDPTFEFYREKELIGSLGFHHGKFIRWPGGWPGDASLTASSADRLIEWLAANGAPEAKHERDGTRDEDARRAKEEADFLCRFPEGVRGFFRSGEIGDETKDAAFASAMAERCGGAEALARCLCRALGESSLGWTVSEWKETRAAAALGAVPGEAFAAAVAALRNDMQGLRGAARLAFQEGMFSKMSPEARGEWGPRLASAAIDSGDPRRAWLVARALGDADSKRSRGVLWWLVEGPNPRGETDPPSLAAAGLISLAKLGDPRAGEQVRQRLTAATDPVERMALEVALAYLGEGTLLRPAHFSGRSSNVVFGAMDAVARSPRREGIEAMVAAMQTGDVHFGFPLAEGFFRATGWSIPIEGTYASVHRMCLAWWKRNGEAFLKKCREGN